MGHRHLFFRSQTSDMDYGDIWNYPHPSSHLQIDSTTSGGVNTMPYFEVTMRPNNAPPSNFSLEIPIHRRPNPQTVHDPYMHSFAGNSHLIQPNYIQPGPPCYNQFTVMDSSITLNPHMEYGRATFKRKNPGISMAFGRGNSNSYNVGSSSDLSNSSAILQPNPMLAPQHWGSDFTNFTPSYRGNNMLTCSDESQRNVRSRQVPSGSYPLSNLPPHHLHPTANISGSTAAVQWNHTPDTMDYHRRMPPSGAGCFNYEMNQSLAGNNSTNMEIDRGYPHNLVYNRSSASHFPAFHCPMQVASGDPSSSYGQRTNPYREISSYQTSGFAGTLEDGRQQGSEVVPPSRHSRPLAIRGRSSERSSRTLYERFQPFSDTNNGHGGWESEDRLTFYDSRNLFDQHQDMRLDIDNMSYEELLALEETIGYVSTGLSEDGISKCLLEIMYQSSNQTRDSEENNCVICLEEYKNTDKLGRLTCQHDFHVGCIKRWLSIKNACPICKASVLPESSKEK